VQQGAGEQDRQSRTANRYPSVAFHYLMGALRAAAGDYEGALEAFDREVRQAGERGLYRTEYAVASLVWRGHALMALGRLDDAAGAFRQALGFIDGHPRALLGLSRALALQHQDAEAAEACRAARAFVSGLRQPDRTAEWLHGTACVAAADGRPDEAVAALNQLLDSLPPSVVGWQLPIDPTFLSLRGHPGFAAVLGRLADRAK
jgi:tetratricopeptide (TPR) repeat protein